MIDSCRGVGRMEGTDSTAQGSAMHKDSETADFDVPEIVHSSDREDQSSVVGMIL